MHRSGTSVTTNLLSAFGVSLSDDLMEPTEYNAKGYFESKEISRVQDAILRSLGMEWSTCGLDVPFPPNWWRSSVVQALKEELAKIVRAELGRHDGLWGFKNPRTARLLPVWNEIFEELELDPRYVLVTRHPTDVARSLFAREAIDPVHAEIMWLDHNVDAVLNTGGKIHAYVDYSGWIESPVRQAEYMLEKLDLRNGRTRTELQSVTAEVVESGLRHHATHDGGFNFPFTAPLYKALLRKDAVSIKSLAEMFNVTRGFTQIVLARSRRRENQTLESPRSAAMSCVAR